MNTDVEKEISSFQSLNVITLLLLISVPALPSHYIRASKKAGIPEESFWLPLVENWFKINAYSRARALGLWQFIPSTGYKFGLSRDEWIDERMDVKNLLRRQLLI